MPRLRFFSKKRGERTSASRSVGIAGWGVASLVLLIVGVVMLSLFVPTVVIPEWRVNRDYVETTCRVLDKRLGLFVDDDGDQTYRPEILIAYEVQQQPYQAWTYDATGFYTSGRARSERALARFDVGSEYPCWYDPLEPSQAVLQRGYTPFAWILVLLPTGFVVLGAGGVAYAVLDWGKSAERRSALVQSARMELMDVAGRAALDYPNVPGELNLNESPGTTLHYRLPPAAGGPSLASLLATSILWNLLVILFGVFASIQFSQGHGQWWIPLLLVPFAAVGVWLVVLVVRQFMLSAGVGPTLAEISDHPLRPGNSYELFVSQVGPLSFNRLAVLLECEEETTYRQGTNTIVDRQVVWRQTLFAREQFQIEPGSPFETRVTLAIPPEAMHSFHAPNNRITWRVVVDGDVPKWPNFQRMFLVVVCPAPEQRAA